MGFFNLKGRKYIMDIRFILFFILSFNAYAARIGTTEPMMEITMGKRAGYENIALVAHNDTVGTTEETLWDEGGNITFPATAATVTLSSSSANDTNAAGTGCRKVFVNGLDASYNSVSETVNMNGTTAVTTVNSYLRLSNGSLVCTEAGSSLGNEGIIYAGTGTVTAGKPATVYNLINTGESQSHVGAYTVPAGKTAVFAALFFTVDGNKSAEIFLKGKGSLATDPWHTLTSFNITGAIGPDPTFGMKFTEKTDLVMSAVMASGSGNVKVTGLLTLIDN